jgi:hypothetical protein
LRLTAATAVLRKVLMLQNNKDSGLREVAGSSQGQIDKREGWRVNAEGVVAAVVQTHRIGGRWTRDRPACWE